MIGRVSKPWSHYKKPKTGQNKVYHSEHILTTKRMQTPSHKHSMHVGLVPPFNKQESIIREVLTDDINESREDIRRVRHA